MNFSSKSLLSCLLLLSSPVAMADDYVLYDGKTGATCAWFNHGAKFKWKNFGGDWVDADGVAQGNKPVDTVDITRYQTGNVIFDVTRIMHRDGFVLRRLAGIGPVAFHSRESLSPPILRVKQKSGNQVQLKPTGDTFIPYDAVAGLCTSQTSAGYGDRVKTFGPIYVQFPPLPPDAVSAQLVMPIYYAYKDTTVGAFGFDAPRPPAKPVTTGIAAQYPGDRGIERHPSVLYVESWSETDRDAWWKKTYFHKPNFSRQFNWTQDNGWFPTIWPGVFRDFNAGPGGDTALREYFPSHSQGYTKTPTFDVVAATGQEEDELYVRYYVKFDKGFLNPPNCDGGKLPGLSGHTHKCANSGGTPDGYCGWSMRMHFALMCDQNNPIHGKIRHSVYAYYPGKKTYYGEVLSSAEGGEHGNFSIGQWTCLEQRIKVNTPGVADGIVQTWVDGRLALDRKNILFRKALDANHPTYSVPGNLGIVKFWGTFHFGGGFPLGGRSYLRGFDGTAWYDQAVVAKTRIGCMAE